MLISKQKDTSAQNHSIIKFLTSHQITEGLIEWSNAAQLIVGWLTPEPGNTPKIMHTRNSSIIILRRQGKTSDDRNILESAVNGTKMILHTNSYPVYAFRQPRRVGWSLIACRPNDPSPERSVRELFRDLYDWRVSGLTINAFPRKQSNAALLGRDYRNTFNGSCSPSWAWDDIDQCWRAPDESIAPPPHVEMAEGLEVTFAQPEHGWIDLRLSTPAQFVEWPLSEVYDPFRSKLTSWMETVITCSQPRLFAYVEHMHARLDVISAEAGTIIIVAHSVTIGTEEKPLAVKMPRSAFVRDFYSALVAFWEGQDLRRNWSSWLRGVEDWRPGEDPTGYWATEPWSIRSEKVERYLAECEALPGPPRTGL